MVFRPPVVVPDRGQNLHEVPSALGQSIRTWRYEEGVNGYSGSAKIMITADGGGSSGYGNRLWKGELRKLANKLSKNVQVSHYSPGTGKQFLTGGKSKIIV
jgi:hypothetical protein